MSDPLLRTLAELPGARPDARRAERVRLRCHAVLARRQRPRRPRRSVGAHFWEPAIAGLGVAYLAEVVRQALHVYGMF